MTLDLPQIVLLSLIIFETGMVLAKHGERKTGANAKYNILSSLISSGIVLGILYWGGFFSA